MDELNVAVEQLWSKVRTDEEAALVLMEIVRVLRENFTPRELQAIEDDIRRQGVELPFSLVPEEVRENGEE